MARPLPPPPGGIILVFTDIERVRHAPPGEPPEIILTDAGNRNIALYQKTAGIFMPDELKCANIVHCEAVIMEPVPDFPDGGVHYKVAAKNGLVVSRLTKPYKPNRHHIFIQLDATRAEVFAFHGMLWSMMKRGTRHSTHRMVAQAKYGAPAVTDLSEVTCSQALILALREAGIDMREPSDPYTHEHYMSSEVTPSRMYVCCMRLVAEGRAHFLPADPTVGRTTSDVGRVLPLLTAPPPARATLTEVSEARVARRRQPVCTPAGNVTDDAMRSVLETRKPVARRHMRACDL